MIGLSIKPFTYVRTYIFTCFAMQAMNAHTVTTSLVNSGLGFNEDVKQRCSKPEVFSVCEIRVCIVESTIVEFSYIDS